MSEQTKMPERVFVDFMGEESIGIRDGHDVVAVAWDDKDCVQNVDGCVEYTLTSTVDKSKRKAVREVLEKIGDMTSMVRAGNSYNSQDPYHMATVNNVGHYQLVDNALSNITETVNKLLTQYQEPTKEQSNER